MSMFRKPTTDLATPSNMASDDIDSDQYTTPAMPMQAEAGGQDLGTEVVDVDKRLSALARRITSAKKRMVESVLTIGEALQEAQGLLADHNGGSFNKWIRQRCNFTPRTAYKYIKAYQVFGSCESKSQRLFDVTAMHVLADDNAPQKAVDEAVDLAGQGEKITTKVAKTLIAKHAPRRRKAASLPAPLIIEVDGGTIAIRPKTADADISVMLMAALRQFRSEGEKDAA